MHALRRLEPAAIPRALDKAERYRLLNEPREAESICLDVLAVEPANQQAIACLAFSLTDRFQSEAGLIGGGGARIDDALQHAAKLSDPYQRAYIRGVIEERWAKALIILGYPRESVHSHVAAALAHFDEADRLAPSGNDDAVLRWNSCVRLIERYGLTAPSADRDAESGEDLLADDVPAR